MHFLCNQYEKGIQSGTVSLSGQIIKTCQSLLPGIIMTVLILSFQKTHAVNYEFKQVLRSDKTWDALLNTRTEGVKIGDLDLDGLNELMITIIMWNEANSGKVPHPRIAVLDPSGDDRFTVTWITPSPYWSLNESKTFTFGDMFNDGRHGSLIIPSGRSITLFTSMTSGFFLGREATEIYEFSDLIISTLGFGDTNGNSNNEVLINWKEGMGITVMEYLPFPYGTFRSFELSGEDGSFSDGAPIFTEDYDNDGLIETIAGDYWESPQLKVFEENQIQTATDNAHLFDYHTIDLDNDGLRELSVKRWNQDHDAMYHAILEDAGDGTWNEVWSREMMHNNSGYGPYIGCASGQLYPFSPVGDDNISFDGIVLKEFDQTGSFIIIRTFSYFGGNSLEETWNSGELFNRPEIITVEIQDIGDGDNDGAPEFWLSVELEDGATDSSHLSCFELSWLDCEVTERIDFGNVIGTKRKNESGSIRNSGNNILLDIIGFESSNDAFSLSLPGNLPIAVQPEDSIIFFVNFQPTRIGSIDGEAIITFKDTIATIMLNGCGLELKDIHLAEMTWQMIGAPYILDNKTVEAVLTADLGPSGRDEWVAYDFVDGSYEDISSSSDSLFKPGHAVWIKSRQMSTISFGNGDLPEREAAFRIPLRSGWNMISNPLYFSAPAKWITVSDTNIVSSVFWIWDGLQFNMLNPDDSLHAGQGMFVNATGEGNWIELSLNTPPSESVFHLDNLSSLAGAHIETRCGRSISWAEFNLNIEGETRLIDSPPMTPDGCRLSLALSGHEGSYAYAILPWNDQGNKAEVVFEGHDDIAHDITFSCNGLPDGFQIAVADKYRDYLVLQENPNEEITIQAIGPISFLQLYLGTDAFIESMSNQYARLPLTIKLDDPFPNPTNSQSIISYSLPYPESVTLAIYDQLGRRVSLIVNSEIKAAGKHQALWTGKDHNGGSLPNGLYFVQLNSNRNQLTRKMVLLK